MKIGVPLRFELDAVVALPERGELLVLEAKDLAIPFSPRRIRSELDKYQRTNGHFEKLFKKVENVASAPAEVAKALGAPQGQYRVRGVFVTRELSPAAFLDGYEAEFVVIDDLARTVG